MKATQALFLAAALLLAGASWAQDRATIERGRYVVRTSGCNDCHTAGYAQAAGKLPESEWLKGDAVGFHGPWGTTYPSNLRRYFAGISEEAFIADARSGRMRPPMPWFSLRDMRDTDLRAIHRYVRSLGASGAPMPAYVPPGEEPRTPYIVFVPQPPKARHARAD